MYTLCRREVFVFADGSSTKIMNREGIIFLHTAAHFVTHVPIHAIYIRMYFQKGLAHYVILIISYSCERKRRGNFEIVI